MKIVFIREETKMIGKPSVFSQPETAQKRDIYMSSLEVHEAIATDNIVVIGHDPPKHGAFMSSMVQLRPGLSDAQRQRDREQREVLRSELENQVGNGGLNG